MKFSAVGPPERAPDLVEVVSGRVGGQTPPPEASSPPAADPFAQLERLGALHRSGALTDDEFAAAKARILGHL